NARTFPAISKLDPARINPCTRCLINPSSLITTHNYCALVLWCSSAQVLKSSGALVLKSSGAQVLWCFEAHARFECCASRKKNINAQARKPLFYSREAQHLST
ncbi:MAG: hypothetical protein AB7C90_04035, partial [Bacteroidales bacterium]